MNASALDNIVRPIVDLGLTGADEYTLLTAFCERCNEAGLPLASAVAMIDTLHPIWEGRAYSWRNDGVEDEAVIEYGGTRSDEGEERWQRTAFYHLHQTGARELRRRICAGDPADFEVLDELHAQGHTDYLAMAYRFGSAGAVGEMDGIFTHWTTREPAGFDEADCAALRQLVPTLVLALKAASLAHITSTLAETYLGRDAAQQVLGGRILRGVTDQIDAVLWFSDLSGFTTITDRSAPDEIIPLLNDYAEIVIAAVHEAGGDVLKLIGDGILAIFKNADRAAACRAALQAQKLMKQRLEAMNARREAAARATTLVRLGLHTGEVLYGNIGSDERLDFTVVGPAVNEASRIVAMCRSVDRDFLVSQEFVAGLPADERARFVSVGRYALRGVRRSLELFTLDREAPDAGI